MSEQSGLFLGRGVPDTLQVLWELRFFFISCILVGAVIMSILEGKSRVEIVKKMLIVLSYWSEWLPGKARVFWAAPHLEVWCQGGLWALSPCISAPPTGTATWLMSCVAWACRVCPPVWQMCWAMWGRPRLWSLLVDLLIWVMSSGLPADIAEREVCAICLCGYAQAGLPSQNREGHWPQSPCEVSFLKPAGGSEPGGEHPEWWDHSCAPSRTQ